MEPESTYNLIILGIKDISAKSNLLTGSATPVKMNMENIFPVKINFGGADYADYQRAQNYPNLFNSQTTFEFNLPSADDVRVDVYDTRGTLVDTLVDQKYPAGRYNLIHDFSIASGVYFYRFNIISDLDTFQSMGKMILLK